MKLGLISIAGAALFLGQLVGCGSTSTTDGTSQSNVEQVDDDGDGTGSLTADTAIPMDDDLGPDREPMMSDDEVDTLAARSDDVQQAEAEDDFAREEAVAGKGVDINEDDVDVVKTAAAKPKPPRCKKRIHVTYAVYTYITSKIGDNGCWLPENTVSDDTFRDCHSDGTITHETGRKWFYDDTNPYNSLTTERARVDACSGNRAGYEYMAFREGRWRLITRPHVYAYFAELYTDDEHIDPLWYEPAVYRSNATLKQHGRAAPMVNFGPYPDGRYSLHEIGIEVLKVCKTIHNHGFLGLYEWHYPIDYGSPRAKNLASALNACTRK